MKEEEEKEEAGTAGGKTPTIPAPRKHHSTESTCCQVSDQKGPNHTVHSSQPWRSLEM